MTNIEEIIITANKLANEGKQPTVALVKAKLTQKQPLPLIISTLKSWQHQPDLISVKGSSAEKEGVAGENSDIEQIIAEQLNRAISPLIKEIQALRAEVESLKQQQR